MECARLKKLVKSWYLSVQEETMAPARMVSFMEQHVAECDICLMDGVVDAEIARITAIVLPPSKIPKAQKKAAAAANAEDIPVQNAEPANTGENESEDPNTDDAEENQGDTGDVEENQGDTDEGEENQGDTGEEEI